MKTNMQRITPTTATKHDAEIVFCDSLDVAPVEAAALAELVMVEAVAETEAPAKAETPGLIRRVMGIPAACWSALIVAVCVVRGQHAWQRGQRAANTITVWLPRLVATTALFMGGFIEAAASGALLGIAGVFLTVSGFVSACLLRRALKAQATTV